MKTSPVLSAQSTSPTKPTKSSLPSLQKLAWLYAALFVGVVAINYVPFLKDSQGRLCGLFKLDWWDDALHLGSAIWAGWAAWRSPRASRLYFQIFGPVYLMDGIVGLIFGQAYLDLGIFLFGPADYPLLSRIGANAPHILIGGFAVYIGYVLSRRVSTSFR